MFSYDKFLQFPIKLKNKNPKLATVIATQYGGAYQNVRVAYLTPPKYAFKRFSVFSAFYNFFKNRPCHVVLFNITHISIIQKLC